MMRCVREMEPEELCRVAEEATQRWLTRLEKWRNGELLKKPEFKWSQRNGQLLNHILLTPLRTMTSSHCSYCDSFPLKVSSKETIDHFKPKSLFPNLAFAWDNLFLCCDFCQSLKKEQYSDGLLKPDHPNYHFKACFWFHQRSGMIRPNPKASLEIRNQAEQTIQILGLNEGERPYSRLDHFRLGSSLYSNRSIDRSKQPFRFMYL